MKFWEDPARMLLVSTIVMLVCGLLFLAMGAANYRGVRSRLLVRKRLQEELTPEELALYQRKVAPAYGLCGAILCAGAALERAWSYAVPVACVIGLLLFDILLLAMNKKYLGRWRP